MNSYVFTKCPSCGGQMRFNRPETVRFVVICPTCKHLFDAGTAQFEKDLVPATLVRSGNPNEVRPQSDGSQQVGQPVVGVPTGNVPTANAPVGNVPVGNQSRAIAQQIPVAERLNLEEYLPPQSLTPVRPINSSPASQRHSNWQTPQRTHSAPRRQFLSAPTIAALGLFVIFGIGAVALLFSSDLRASLGIGRFRELVLVERYATALKECQQHLANPLRGIEDPEVLLTDKLSDLEKLLVDCVRMKTISESRHVELRSEMQKLFESQMMLKESEYRIVPNLSGEQRLKFAKLTALISLIELRLSFGLREVPAGSNEVDAYSRKGILLLRDLDRSLLAAREGGFEQHLPEIATILDKLDGLAVQRIEAGELRGDMSFDYRLMAKASEGWHQWCLSHSGSQVASQVMRRAIDRERANTWDRYNLALTATSLSPRYVASLDRIREQIRNDSPHLSTSGLLAAGDTRSATQSTDANSETSSLNAHISQNQPPQGLASATVSGASTHSASTNGAASNSLLAGPEGDVNAQRARRYQDRTEVAAVESPMPIRPSEGSVAPAREPAPDAGTRPGEDSRDRSDTASQQDVASDSMTADLDFPTPHITGPNSFCVKVQSSQPDRIKRLASELGTRLKLLPNIQIKGNLITITYAPYSGSLNDAVKLIEFGRIEIIDGQTRTLFVVDR